MMAIAMSLCACNVFMGTGTGSAGSGETATEIEGSDAALGNNSNDLTMIGTTRKTYENYLNEYLGAQKIFSDPIYADIDNAIFSMDTDFVEVSDKPEGEAEPAAAEDAQAVPEYTTEDYEVVNGYEGREGTVLMWKGAEGRLELNVTVPKSGWYAVYMDYFALSKEARTIELEFYVNGKRTFSAAERINMSRLWHNENDVIAQDSRGNDLNPSQIAYNAWINNALRDCEGLYDAPYTFYFNEGVNTLTFIGARAHVAIGSVYLYNEPEKGSYADYISGANLQENGYYQMVQGETPSYTSNPALHPIYDRSSVDTIPSDPILLKRNTMGGANWQSQGQYAVYTFDVPADGWYKIAVRYRQSVARGLKTYRRLYVNGSVPFAEAECVSFKYSDYWQTTVLGEVDNGEPYYFYLKAGKNEIRLEAITGPTGDIISELDDMVYEFNYIYRKIIMITGLDPDPYRDYHLESDIPTLLPTLTRLKTLCEDIKERLIAVRGGKSSSEVASLTNMSVQLKSLLKDPETIPVRLSSFKDNISALAALSVKLKEQPLELDYLTLTAKGVEEFVGKKGFFKNLGYKLRAYFATYVEDYNSVGSNAEGEDVLQVWVNLGRDQANLIKEMSDSDFTSATGIRVKVSLVQQNLIQANIANDGPDVVLFVDGGSVVNLAAREALVDMSQFKSWEIDRADGNGAYKVSSYDEVMSRFSTYAGEPYKFTDKTGHTGRYAIPVTEAFNMLFYRTDIFEELGLEPPKTWDEFYRVLTILQNNNMQVGIPSGSDAAVDSGIFLSLLKQNGVSLYSDDLKKTNLDTTTALSVFKQWTGFYSQYSMPQRYDLYTRFRTGEMPMGFAGYTFVNQLNYAAPELKGLWEMVPIPGTVQEDGTVDNTVCGGGAGALIYTRAVKRGVEDAAWAYIDWFTSEDTQAKYGFDIETLLGAAGRYDTANLAAAERLPWTAKEMKVLKEQWSNMFINPVVIGDYYYGRNITFAFRNVVIYAKNPREMLLSYNKEINNEITVKREEFGLEVDKDD